MPWLTLGSVRATRPPLPQGSRAGQSSSLFLGSTHTGVGSFTGVAPADIVSICSGGRVRVSNSDAAAALIPEVEEEEVFENERYMPMNGFKASHLLPMDPCRCGRLRAALVFAAKLKPVASALRGLSSLDLLRPLPPCEMDRMWMLIACFRAQIVRPQAVTHPRMAQRDDHRPRASQYSGAMLSWHECACSLCVP